MSRSNQNWEARDIWAMPTFRIDTSTPQMGANGSLAYAMYSFNSSNDVNLTGLTEGGSYRIYNDRFIEIVAGNKTSEKGVDIVITSMAGDVTINALRNGSIRIKGKNITIEADEDVDIKAGRNISMKGGAGRILLDSNIVDAKGLSGNVISKVEGGTFGTKVFDGTYVAKDVLEKAMAALPNIPVTGNNVDATTTSKPCIPSSGISTSGSTASTTADLDAELSRPITNEERAQVRSNTVPGVTIL